LMKKQSGDVFAMAGLHAGLCGGAITVMMMSKHPP